MPGMVLNSWGFHSDDGKAFRGVDQVYTGNMRYEFPDAGSHAGLRRVSMLTHAIVSTGLVGPKATPLVVAGILSVTKSFSQ